MQSHTESLLLNTSVYSGELIRSEQKQMLTPHVDLGDKAARVPKMWHLSASWTSSSPLLITHYLTFRSSFQAACDKNPINGNCCLLLNVVLDPREKTWQLWLNSWDYPYCCVGEKWGIKLISSILINTKNTDFCGLSQIKGKKKKIFLNCGWYKQHADLISLNLNDLVLTSANFLGVTGLVVPGFVTLSLSGAFWILHV